MIAPATQFRYCPLPTKSWTGNQLRPLRESGKPGLFVHPDDRQLKKIALPHWRFDINQLNRNCRQPLPGSVLKTATLLLRITRNEGDNHWLAIDLAALARERLAVMKSSVDQIEMNKDEVAYGIIGLTKAQFVCQLNGYCQSPVIIPTLKFVRTLRGL